MLKGPTTPSTINYYLAWRLVESVRNEEQAIRKDNKLRSLLRKVLNPENINEGEFVKRYRLSKSAFKFLCEILRNKTDLRSSKRVSLEHKVLCALSFYASGSYQRIVGETKYLGQTTVSKYVREVTNALNSPGILNVYIKFPTSRAERDHIRQKFYDQYGIPGVIGCIDGSHFHIFSPKKEIEHLFFCRKHYYSLNVQMVCDSESRIININSKYGGATHDAFIWENSAVNTFMQELHRNNEYTWLLGDSGYPQRPWLMTPIPDAQVGSAEAKYTAIHGRTRAIIENTFGRMKNRWRCVSKDRVLHYTPETCAKIIIACAVLHNLAIEFRLPDPDSDDDEIAPTEDFIRREVPTEDSRGEDLIRGRAMRDQLVERLNSIH